MARILCISVLFLMASCGNGGSSTSYRIGGDDVGGSARPETYSGDRPYLPYQPRVNGGGGGMAMGRDNSNYRIIHNVGETFQTNAQQ